jgi:acetyl esterase/lipase
MPLDPDLDALLKAVPPPRISDPALDYLQVRKTFDSLAELLPVTIELPEVRDLTVPGPDGAPPVSVRLYRPPADTPPGPAGLPAVLLLHGGGWVFGSVRSHDHVARRIAAGTGALVVSVDYRLAPEHPYPAAVDDCWAALEWLAGHAAEVGADPARIALAGDSAGGNLAAALTLLARDRGGPALCFQLLWYPAVMLDPELPSQLENADAPVLNAADGVEFARLYVGHLMEGHPTGRPPAEELPATLAPGHAADLTGLPPAYVAVAQYDPLRDDGVRYVARLREAGVPATVRNFETMVHGFVNFAPVVAAAGAATDETLLALRDAFHPPGAGPAL